MRWCGGAHSRTPAEVQLNGAPSVQTAIGTAVSIGGDASAAAANSNGVSQSDLR